ncbi:hypothetical protein GJ699_02460 [Duganella sp. FT80W]|uniref:Uncharacterized protein n=1 Tax=Duganella guangzhouensis TaxID=2666084 RepID=A0A6I2KTC0_9BURK|nr:hypothetical protein [Duganella guangzhouensis]MRW88841.1 hypothetical protein [Duganella guangzhouensis]
MTTQVKNALKPTDDQIVAAMHTGGLMTYVVANRLRWTFPGLDTAFVLRRLKVMEKAGRVRRVASSYGRQICWTLVEVQS